MKVSKVFIRTCALRVLQSKDRRFGCDEDAKATGVIVFPAATHGFFAKELHRPLHQ
jgi:hypothetical protein